MLIIKVQFPFFPKKKKVILITAFLCQVSVLLKRRNDFLFEAMSTRNKSYSRAVFY